MWTRSPRSECEKIRARNLSRRAHPRTCEWTDLVFHSTTWRDSIFFQEVIGKRLPAVWLMENNFFRYFLWCILLNLNEVVWIVISYRRRVHGSKWAGGGDLLFSGCGGRLLIGKLQLLKLPSFLVKLSNVHNKSSIFNVTCYAVEYIW